jgi:hypothetical protein
MTPQPQTEDEFGIAPDAYAHHDQTEYVPAFEEPRPTPKQLNYLRSLAQRTGQTFAYPRTAGQASREIRRLKNTPASSRTRVRIERKQIADQIAAGPANNSTAVRVDEITGHGSTATWAQHRDREPAVAPDPAPKRKTPEVGPRTVLARYTIAGRARVVFGQRVDGVVRVSDCPTGAGGRSYLVERGLEQDGNRALKALIADYLDQAERHQTIPVLVDADRYLAHLR